MAYRHGGWLFRLAAAAAVASMDILNDLAAAHSLLTEHGYVENESIATRVQYAMNEELASRKRIKELLVDLGELEDLLKQHSIPLPERMQQLIALLS